MSRKSVLKQKSRISTQEKPRGAHFTSPDNSAVIQPRLAGYDRVSTDDQTTRLQLDALKAAGCGPVFDESESGAHESRPRLDRALEELQPGDTLVV